MDGCMLMSFPPLLCRDRYPKWLEKIEVTADGLQIGPIKIPVAQSYGSLRVIRGIQLQPVYSPSRALMTYEWETPPPSPPADLEHEHDYIMNKALKSYKLYRDKEKAENRQRTLRSARQKRWKVPHPNRPVQSAGTERTRPNVIQKDAINEVMEANLSEEELKTKHQKKVIELHRVNVGRAFELNRLTIGGTSMEQSPSPTKSASFNRRNTASHQWYSQSVPNTSYMNFYNGHTAKSQGHQSRHSHSIKVPRAMSAQRSDNSSRPDSAVSSSYYNSNDGGVFNPQRPKHEYFVIHPEWVSESMTIQKLSLSERKPMVISKSNTWPGRRCKSAPPSKLRNPITWNVEQGSG